MRKSSKVQRVYFQYNQDEVHEKTPKFYYGIYAKFNFHSKWFYRDVCYHRYLVILRADLQNNYAFIVFMQSTYVFEYI